MKMAFPPEKAPGRRGRAFARLHVDLRLLIGLLLAQGPRVVLVFLDLFELLLATLVRVLVLGEDFRGDFHASAGSSVDEQTHHRAIIRSHNVLPLVHSALRTFEDDFGGATEQRKAPLVGLDDC